MVFLFWEFLVAFMENGNGIGIGGSGVFFGPEF